MKLAFTSCVLLAAVLVTGIDADSLASLNPKDLIFCGRQKKQSGTLSCRFQKSDFSDGTDHIDIDGYMGTEWIGGVANVSAPGFNTFQKWIDVNDISRSNASHITFTCTAKSNKDQKNTSVDVPMMYPPEEPPYLKINDEVIQGPEAKIQHDGTFEIHCGVNGGLPSTNLTLTCTGHGPVSKNTSVQMSVEKAANGTKCTCRGNHPSGCYDNSTTEVTLIISQKVQALQCPAGKFGLDCAKDCNCREQCDVKTGKCLAGCEPGCKNSDCQQPVKVYKTCEDFNITIIKDTPSNLKANGTFGGLMDFWEYMRGEDTLGGPKSRQGMKVKNRWRNNEAGVAYGEVGTILKVHDPGQCVRVYWHASGVKAEL